MIKVLHANYGAGYLWALHEWANPEEIKEATGVDYHQMKKEIIKVNDNPPHAPVSTQFKPSNFPNSIVSSKKRKYFNKI